MKKNHASHIAPHPIYLIHEKIRWPFKFGFYSNRSLFFSLFTKNTIGLKICNFGLKICNFGFLEGNLNDLTKLL